MSITRTTICLLMCLSLNFAPALLNAQEQNGQAEMQTDPSASPSLAELLKRSQEAERELASIKEQMRAPLTEEARRALLERMDHLEQKVQQLKRDVEVAKRQQFSSSTAKSATTASGCGALRVGNNEVKDVAFCKWRRGTPDVQSRSYSSSQSETVSKIIQQQRLKELTVDLANDRGQLGTGPNDFCIEFRSSLDSHPVDPGKVQAEATMELRRVRAMRAVVHLWRADIGRYCAQVDFPMPGSWAIAVEYKGPSGKGRAAFSAQIN